MCDKILERHQKFKLLSKKKLLDEIFVIEAIVFICLIARTLKTSLYIYNPFTLEKFLPLRASVKNMLYK